MAQPPNVNPPPPPPPPVPTVSAAGTQDAIASKVLAKMTGEYVLNVDDLRVIVDPNGAEAAALRQFRTLTLQQFQALYQSPAGGPTARLLLP